MVDNKELDLLGRLSRSRLADFKSQLQQWWDAESRVLKDLSPEEIHSRVNRTVFVVSFGVWDIWSLITTDYESASESVERRIATLVGLLDTLSERVGALNLLVTQTVDVTFLPGFGSVGDQYKDTVRILDRWNERLREVTRDWDRGTVYLFDTNTFVMDRIRDWQLYAAGIEEENGLGKNLDRWENVVEPCVESRVMMSKQTQCAHPDRYLFW